EPSQAGRRRHQIAFCRRGRFTALRKYRSACRRHPRRSRCADHDPPSDPMSEKLPIRMLHDRLLVSVDKEKEDRRSSGGIVIPATATMGKRLAWARVEASGPHVRTVQLGDRVLFDPEERPEVEVRGEDFILLRERDVHAVASERIEEGQTGLYL